MENGPIKPEDAKELSSADWEENTGAKSSERFNWRKLSFVDSWLRRENAEHQTGWLVGLDKDKSNDDEDEESDSSSSKEKSGKQPTAFQRFMSFFMPSVVSKEEFPEPEKAEIEAIEPGAEVPPQSEERVETDKVNPEQHANHQELKVDHSDIEDTPVLEETKLEYEQLEDEPGEEITATPEVLSEKPDEPVEFDHEQTIPLQAQREVEVQESTNQDSTSQNLTKTRRTFYGSGYSPGYVHDLESANRRNETEQRKQHKKIEQLQDDMRKLDKKVDKQPEQQVVAPEQIAQTPIEKPIEARSAANPNIPKPESYKPPQVTKTESRQQPEQVKTVLERLETPAQRPKQSEVNNTEPQNKTVEVVEAIKQVDVLKQSVEKSEDSVEELAYELRHEIKDEPPIAVTNAAAIAGLQTALKQHAAQAQSQNMQNPTSGAHTNSQAQNDSHKSQQANRDMYKKSVVGGAITAVVIIAIILVMMMAN